ncbi:transcriptional regulator, Crp/Fnr family [hydrothermal vent metagenome]|uniref:Transcriptional regulator, Crp/Fnr family n=1 Tax=hydrothermal vent metagenome TaxID=652676 RepID=A0A1W1EHK4_9ZZZZ
MNNIIEKLKKATIFQNLDDKQLNYLISISYIKSYKKDNIIFYKGDTPNYMYLLLDGSINIYKHNIRGNEVILKSINNISLIAELANLEEVPYPSNCITKEDSKILVIDYKKFKDYFLSNPEFLFLFVKSLTQQLMKLEEILSRHIALNANAKVAKYIYENEEKFNKYSKVNIAKILNITPETLSRIIKKFKNEGVLVVNNGKLTINSFIKIREYFID